MVKYSAKPTESIMIYGISFDDECGSGNIALSTVHGNLSLRPTECLRLGVRCSSSLTCSLSALWTCRHILSVIQPTNDYVIPYRGLYPINRGMASRVPGYAYTRPLFTMHLDDISDYPYHNTPPQNVIYQSAYRQVKKNILARIDLVREKWLQSQTTVKVTPGMIPLTRGRGIADPRIQIPKLQSSFSSIKTTNMCADCNIQNQQQKASPKKKVEGCELCVSSKCRT